MSSRCHLAPVAVAKTAVAAMKPAASWSKGHSSGPSSTPGSVHVQCRPSQRRNMTVDSVASAAPPMVSASVVSMWTIGSSGEADNVNLLRFLERQDSDGVVGVDRGDGAGNGTRDVRRRVVADLAD